MKLDEKLSPRAKMLLFSTLELLRKEIRPQFSDWKDADDWLFAHLDFTKDELAQIYEGRNVYYYDASAIDDAAAQKAYEESLPAFFNPGEINILGDTLYWGGTKFYLDAENNLLCLLPKEEQPRNLRIRIQDIREGDAFFLNASGSIITTSANAYLNHDESDGRWLAYGDDGEVYFEDDIDAGLGGSMKDYLLHLSRKNTIQKISFSDLIFEPMGAALDEMFKKNNWELQTWTTGTSQGYQVFFGKDVQVDNLYEYGFPYLYEKDELLAFAKDFYERHKHDISISELKLDYVAYVDGSTLFVDCWNNNGDVEIFRDAEGTLFCQLPDEDEPRPLRDRIQDIEDGDAFFFGNAGLIRTSAETAHQNFDEPDNPWITYGDDNECYFEEDIGSSLGQKVRALLENLPAREAAYHDVSDFPIQDYDAAIQHLRKVLNQTDYELDFDDVHTPLNPDDFIPIFKSKNYFGLHCWHKDGNEYYLVDRNTGEQKLVLNDSFEFVGKNMLDCMKNEEILNVANKEWMRYLIDFSLENVKDCHPIEELKGIATLQSALRAEWMKEGAYFPKPSLADQIQAASTRAAEPFTSGKNLKIKPDIEPTKC